MWAQKNQIVILRFRKCGAYFYMGGVRELIHSGKQDYVSCKEQISCVFPNINKGKVLYMLFIINKLYKIPLKN